MSYLSKIGFVHRVRDKERGREGWRGGREGEGRGRGGREGEVEVRPVRTGPNSIIIQPSFSLSGFSCQEYSSCYR